MVSMSTPVVRVALRMILYPRWKVDVSCEASPQIMPCATYEQKCLIQWLEHASHEQKCLIQCYLQVQVPISVSNRAIAGKIIRQNHVILDHARMTLTRADLSSK